MELDKDIDALTVEQLRAELKVEVREASRLLLENIRLRNEQYLCRKLLRRVRENNLTPGNRALIDILLRQ